RLTTDVPPGRRAADRDRRQPQRSQHSYRRGAGCRAPVDPARPAAPPPHPILAHHRGLPASRQLSLIGQPKVFRAEWVLPVAAPPIHRGEVLVGADGRIAGVAPVGALEFPSDITVHDLGETILLPGLVNVHAHPELTMFRGAL